MSDIQDSDELVRFRQAWKAEVRNRLAQTQNVTSRKAHTKTAGDRSNQEGVPVVVTQDNTHDAQPRPSAGPSYARAHHSGESITASKSLASAIETYRLAVQYEQEGDLDSALVHYKHAFRLDSHVDKAYRKEELRVAALGGGQTSHTRKKSTDDEAVEEIREGLQKVAIEAPSKSAAVAGHGTLAALIASFPSDLRYEPEDERRPVRLNMLPNEIMVHALRYLDATSIERFASVCRKARLVSLDSGVWVSHVRTTYVPPQLLDASVIHEIAETYDWNFRRIYIEQPRVRLDGVYIAVCHYIRPGLSENVWVHVSHLVTYHRFLRFLPDGQVVSLLTNEEVEPRSVIPLLKPGVTMSGCATGKWALRGSEVVVTDLENTHGKPLRHTFQMTLTLRSRPLGRWNKMDMISYESINRDDGEVIPLLLKHERPFWFSKVRSYT